MAHRRRRKRNFSRYLRGLIDIDLPIALLGANTVTSQNSSLVTDAMRVSSIRCTYAMTDPAAQGESDGPLIFGVAHGDYTTTELEEYLEVADSWDEGNLVGREQRGRKVRMIGTLDLDPLGTGTWQSVNDGKPITTKLNWLMEEGETVQWWVYNPAATALGTTGMDFHAFGHANLWGV